MADDLTLIPKKDADAQISALQTQIATLQSQITALQNGKMNNSACVDVYTIQSINLTMAKCGRIVYVFIDGSTTSTADGSVIVANKYIPYVRAAITFSNDFNTGNDKRLFWIQHDSNVMNMGTSGATGNDFRGCFTYIAKNTDM